MWTAIALGFVIGSLAGALAGGFGKRFIVGFLSAVGIVVAGTTFLVGSTAVITGASILGGFFPFVLACIAALTVAYLAVFAVMKRALERDERALSE
ncbi:MAG TPA: hypothetical protein VFX67_11035 [Burkholderiales bacterium]|nr:hypothetical protein [Burkholderiales bacterium]